MHPIQRKVTTERSRRHIFHLRPFPLHLKFTGVLYCVRYSIEASIPAKTLHKVYQASRPLNSDQGKSFFSDQGESFFFQIRVSQFCQIRVSQFLQIRVSQILQIRVSQIQVETGRNRDKRTEICTKPQDFGIEIGQSQGTQHKDEEQSLKTHLDEMHAKYKVVFGLLFLLLTL